MLTDAIEAARREGAEWMREMAAREAMGFDDSSGIEGDGHAAAAIRALPLVPK